MNTSLIKVLGFSFLFAATACTKTLYMADDIGAQIISIERSCDKVNLRALYRDPAPYAGRYVCTSGTLHLEPTLVAIVPRAHSFKDLQERALSPNFGYTDLKNLGLAHGDRIIVSGIFSIDEACYESYMGVSSEAPAEQVICLPVNVPMYLEVYSLEKV